jgi:crotonobetainyl-CoA:carnitine CoA-transferase CaiB-like acyl-CoA transferase
MKDGHPSPAPAGALADVVVIDATQMLAGPLAAMRLGDLGADVIKVEAPGYGEFNRTHGFDDVRIDGEMSTFVALNRNKRSLALDLKSPQGRQILRDLAVKADVFIHNFRVGTAERLGIDYPTLSEANPRLVYCSISGYGTDGPLRNRPGQDLVLQGYSGSMWSVGKKDDPPTPSALWAADVMTGYQATIGILAAMHARALSGAGQHVEVDMLSVILDAQLQELVTYLNSGQMPQRSGEPSAHASIPAPYGVYATADGWLTLAMCPLPALGEALDDDWLRSLTDYNDGSVHRDGIYAHIRPRFGDRTTAEWLETLDRHNVWAGPVYTYEDVSADAHVRSQGLIVEQEHRGGSVETVSIPIKMSTTSPSIRRGAPELGEHSAEILRDLLGYELTAIHELADQDVIGLGQLLVKEEGSV